MLAVLQALFQNESKTTKLNVHDNNGFIEMKLPEFIKNKHDINQRIFLSQLRDFAL